MKKDETGGTCGMYGSRKKCMQGVWWGNMKEGDHLQKPRHEDAGWEGVGWTNVAQDRDRWWDVVNGVMNLHRQVQTKETRI
jgi:hypothetical protein